MAVPCPALPCPALPCPALPCLVVPALHCRALPRYSCPALTASLLTPCPHGHITLALPSLPHYSCPALTASLLTPCPHCLITHQSSLCHSLTHAIFFAQVWRHHEHSQPHGEHVHGRCGGRGCCMATADMCACVLGGGGMDTSLPITKQVNIQERRCMTQD